MSDLTIPGRRHGEPPKAYVLDRIDRSIIQMALVAGEQELWRYVPEIMSLCARLDIKEPPWFEDEKVRDRVELNLADWPRRDT